MALSFSFKCKKGSSVQIHVTFLGKNRLKRIPTSLKIKPNPTRGRIFIVQRHFKKHSNTTGIFGQEVKANCKQNRIPEKQKRISQWLRTQNEPGRKNGEQHKVCINKTSSF